MVDRFTLQGPDGSQASISELRDGFRQGFVLEILDTETGRTWSQNGVFIFPLNPTDYTLSEPFQSTITPGDDDTVIAEEQGIIVREITLQGTFGLNERRAQGFQGAQGQGAALSGTEHFEELRNFLRFYSSLKKNAELSRRARMIFHALRTDDHFIVVPRSFEVPRNNRTRVHFAYRLTLAAIEEATRSGLVPEDAGGGIDFLAPIRDISEAFHDARAAIAELSAGISELQTRVSVVGTALVNASQLVNAVGGFLAGITDVINFPLRLVATVSEQLVRVADDLYETIDEGSYGVFTENERSIRRIEAAFATFAMYPEKFENLGNKIEGYFNGETDVTRQDIVDSRTESALGAGGATVGTNTRLKLGSAGRAGLEIPRGNGFARYEVLRTDTIESIATATGASPEAIIIVNELRPPYITREGGPGIAKPGDVLLAPARTPGEGTTGVGIRDYLEADEALYGADLALDAEVLEREGLFDLAVDTSNGATDAATRSGIENVAQGIQILIRTERGTTVFAPDLGQRRNVGRKGTIQHVLLSSILLREAVLADRRVTGVESSRVVLDGDVLTQEITVTVAGQRPSATFVLPFGRASTGS